MNTPPAQATPPADTEFAAGGLVWSTETSPPHLAVVHRPKYGDWTLPKGRPKPDETLDATALREAMEETGFKAAPDKLAGSYCYLKEGQVKVVLIWHMKRLKERHEHPAPKDEIDEVLWLPPDQALGRLSHPAERELLLRHDAEMLARSTDPVSAAPCPSADWLGAKLQCLQAILQRCGRFLRAVTGRVDPQLNRLKARLQSAREEFEGCTKRLDEEMTRHPATVPDCWWVPSVRCSLDKAQGALERGDLDGGWGAVHDAERFMIFGYKDLELVARAVSLKAEAQEKLGGGWRSQTVETLLAPLNLKDCLKAGGPLNPKERGLLEGALVQSLAVMNESSDTVYHRMHLVGKQLNFLVVVCAFILAATLWGSYLLADSDSVYAWERLTAVALAGALGGVVSAMFQLSRIGETKIPDALLYGLITHGRPLLGAASALFMYFVMQAKLISFFNATEGTGLEAGVVVGFAAGFAERLVLKAVNKVTGTEEAESAASKKRRHPADESGSSASATAKPE